MSLYGRLFTYRPRPSRLPLEDFLSEALADLLNRLPRARHVTFVADVLLRGDAGAAWLSFMARKPDAQLEWTTQHTVREGPTPSRADMVLLVDGRERLVVESKVGAPIRGHTAAIGGDEDGGRDIVVVADPNQLTTYGAWLARRCHGHCWPGALVLLTHRSEPPRGYGPIGYGVPHVVTCRWRDVWKWARATGAEGSNPAQGAWAPLAAELAAFLEAQRMSADYMKQNDVAQAQVFIAAADRIQHTFNAIEERLRGLKAELGSGSFKTLDYSAAGAVTWTWFYLRKPFDAKWYVAWGIRFPEASQWWTKAEPPLPPVTHAFVALGTDGRAVPVAALEGQSLQGGWAKAGDHELVVGRKLSDFPSDADLLAAELSRWVAASIETLKPTLAKLVAAAGS